MYYDTVFTPARLDTAARKLFADKKAGRRLDGWFLVKETEKNCAEKYKALPRELYAANVMREVVNTLPLYIDEDNIFAGTQDDAFARTYALINPAFRVETFSGYCDPTAVYGDIEPNETYTKERIEQTRRFVEGTDFVKTLTKVYADCENDTSEVIYFVEQVTGHVIPDFRAAVKNGVRPMIERIDALLPTLSDETKITNYKAMRIMLENVLTLAARYRKIAEEQLGTASEARKAELTLMIGTLNKVPGYGAETLYEAMQSYLLLWQMMCLEQTPNPFAFSVGNADRIFEPYRAADKLPRDIAAGLFKHFLVFYNVGDRSWAISQNVLLSGRDNDGHDLTNEMTYAILDAYYEMNLPQPILSVKLHGNTPTELYRSLGRFFFTPGCLTPSLFNDDALFVTLGTHGIDREDLPDYSVAGCQEPLIMGKDNGNTTNSWFNMGKVLELILNDGVSAITGKRLDQPMEQFDAKYVLTHIRELFYEKVEYFAKRMADAANGASRAVECLPVPFLSAFMGGMETGYDMRDTKHQGTKYNASGCLIHGLSVVADSFVAIDELMKTRPNDAERLLKALRTDFKDDEEMLSFVKSCKKYGNNEDAPDNEAVEIASRVSDIIASQKNYLGNPFRADWSSPTTHLLYGYLVGATPDGRRARDMLGYGVDPLYGDAQKGLGFRMLSVMKLPFEKFNGGYASHFGIDPQYFKGETYEEKGEQFYARVIRALFFNPEMQGVSPSYLYVNVTTPETLRKVLAHPEIYAPGGVYIMRIHGTFVNFLDLSPAIQEDIIRRLDLHSTALC